MHELSSFMDIQPEVGTSCKCLHGKQLMSATMQTTAGASNYICFAPCTADAKRINLNHRRKGAIVIFEGHRTRARVPNALGQTQATF